VGERPLVVLDRDGTLIDVVRDEETGSIVTAFHPSHVRILPFVVEGLLRLKNGGFRFAIATNQPGPAKGQISADAVLRTNAALVDALAREGLAIEQVAVCMHHPSVSDCECRKPKPGMFFDLARDLGADLSSSWCVGDTITDVVAGRAAKMKTALLFDRRRCELCPLRDGITEQPDVSGANLVEIAEAILKQ